MSRPTPGGVILCGGASRRMGRPKALLPFGPEVLLRRIVRLVSQEADPLVVVAAAGQELPPLPSSVTVVRDPVPDQGPLPAIGTGLAALPASVDLAYLTATDGPFLAPGWIGHVASRVRDHDLAIPCVDGRHHPLAAVYRRSTVLPIVLSLVATGHRRLLDILPRLRTRLLDLDELRGIDPELRTLLNLNSPADYAEALATLTREDLDPITRSGGS